MTKRTHKILDLILLKILERIFLAQAKKKQIKLRRPFHIGSVPIFFAWQYFPDKICQAVDEASEEDLRLLLQKWKIEEAKISEILKQGEPPC